MRFLGILLRMNFTLESNNIELRLRSYIKEKRYEHSRGVRNVAVELAKRYGCPVYKAEVAALLHDVARDLPESELRLILEKGGPGSRPGTANCNQKLLLHAPAGRIIAREDFGVEDEEILRSIELHTTAGPSMSLLDKIIYIADFIEPGRNFRGVNTARRLAKQDIDICMKFILSFMLRYLLRMGMCICEDTLLAYNEYVGKGTVVKEPERGSGYPWV
jgi:predicted HD superfamily hydrolase involved in NAD metabolism